MKYTPTIGLEIHAELKTRTKMFCDSKNDPEERRPNVNVCPVCMGHPGTLPVINKEAVRHVLRVGVAVGGTCADFTEFDRKNYFYPDIPKGYQISQYKYPLVTGGNIGGVALTRVHLEEDTARSIHASDKSHSLVDFNRAGVPLMELVTEPVIHSGEEAVVFAKELQLLLRYLRVADADMEKGQMRVEANISVSRDKSFGTKVEVKNLNSFRSVERAIAYETNRQIAASERGEEIVQETRGWDDAKGETFSQRKKEYSHDYRYFSDPDVPKLNIAEIAEFSPELLRGEILELPWQRRKRYLTLGLKKENADMFVMNPLLGDFFDDVSELLIDNQEDMLRAANYIASDLAGLIEDAGGVAPLFSHADAAQSFAKLMRMLGENTVSSRGAKDILAVLFTDGGDPQTVAAAHGMLQQSDEGALRAIVEKLVAAHPSVVAEYKAGKMNALQFLVGQGMKETKGAGNPLMLRKFFEDTLK